MEGIDIREHQDQAERDVGGGEMKKAEGGRERRTEADRSGRVEVNDRGADDSG